MSRLRQSAIRRPRYSYSSPCPEDSFATPGTQFIDEMITVLAKSPRENRANYDRRQRLWLVLDVAVRSPRFGHSETRLFQVSAGAQPEPRIELVRLLRHHRAPPRLGSGRDDGPQRARSGGSGSRGTSRLAAGS